MSNPIEILNTKKRYLCDMKREAQLNAQKVIEELDKQIADVDRALEVINEATKQYLCPRCDGTGLIRRPDAARQMEDCECPMCRGTGIKLAGKEGSKDDA